MGIALTEAANDCSGCFFSYLHLFLLTSMESLLLWPLWLYCLLAFFLSLWQFLLFTLLFYLFPMFVYFMGSSSHSRQNSGYSRVACLFHKISPNNHVYPRVPSQPSGLWLLPICISRPGVLLSSSLYFKTVALYSLDILNGTWARPNLIRSLPWKVFLY